jgi:hypothetical protein
MKNWCDTQELPFKFDFSTVTAWALGAHRKETEAIEEAERKWQDEREDRAKGVGSDRATSTKTYGKPPAARRVSPEIFLEESLNRLRELQEGM